MLLTLQNLWQQAMDTEQQDLERAAARLTEQIGGKAAKLARLQAQGFPVPQAWALGADVYQEFRKKQSFPIGLRTGLENILAPNVRYAVRSSSLFEDLANASFAGQYHTSLRVQGAEAVELAIKECYASMFSDGNLSYSKAHDIEEGQLAMAVLIQEMVEADAAGVLFTVDPIGGKDTEFVAEVTYGTGEKLVAGESRAWRYRYDWRTEKYIEEPEERVLRRETLEELMTLALRVQEHFGYPVDIEFAVLAGKVYLLQARPITAIGYDAYEDLWSTADFKDGGVSATVCKPLMWGLYEYIWETKLKEFILTNKMLAPREMRKLGDMFFGRPYWNLSVVKLAMSKIPGYIERDFDMQYGVRGLYEGEGQKTKFTGGSLFHVVRIALAQKGLLKRQAVKLESFLEERQAKYDELLALLEDGMPPAKLAIMFYYLTNVEYLENEGTYFWQIFINTIQQSLYKDKIRKWVGESGYLSLLGGLEDISHLRPFEELWQWSREIKRNPELAEKYTETSAEDLGRAYLSGGQNNSASESRMAEFLKLYGYHSDRELDISYPNYHEDPTPVFRSLKDFLQMADEEGPAGEQEKQKLRFEQARDSLLERAKGRKAKSLAFTVEEMRSMLWWREELRDMSTKYYDLIRRYSLAFGKSLAEQKVLEDGEDIFFLTLEEVWAYTKGQLEPEEVRRAVAKHKSYYLSFRNYRNRNEIGRAFSGQEHARKSDGKNVHHGLGANAGVVEGVARVIAGPEEMHLIQPGDILITKFTDTGWTAKFAILKGIVTEYGGVLCHAAIVSREYGLPCIVHAEDIMAKVPDGARVRLDGSLGTVEVLEAGPAKAGEKMD